MSLYPAATALNTFEVGTQPRQSMTYGYSSPLYIVHKDLTKTLEHPNTVQEILNGTSTGGSTDTDTQYCVRLRVPPGSRSVCLYWYAQVLLSASTGLVDVLSMTLASSGAIRFNIYGRFPDNPSGTTYDAVAAGLTNAVALDSLGGWRCIGQVLSATGTGSGLTCMSASGNNAPGFAATVHEVSSVRRVMIGHMSDGRQALGTLSTPYLPMVNGGSTAATMPSDSAFGFPLMGAQEIFVAPYTSAGTPNPSFSCSGTSVSSVDFVAMACSFHA